MVARMAGSRKTPDRVVQLLQGEVKKTSQAATARATGLTLRGVQNYLKGIGDPTTATLEKLAAYFKVSVSYLRGESVIRRDGVSTFEHLDLKTPEGEREYFKIMDQFTMESILDVESGIKKYPELWELFLSIPDENKEEAFSVLKNYMGLSITGHRIFWERNKLPPK